ncbi:MAG: major capsid protein [Mu-like cryoconite phage AB09]|nr:MAG: major capsid protein [Mu-like cryoconite phage AB09]
MSIEKKHKLDSGETIFFARELEQIKSRSYDVKYAELKARSLIPVSYDAGPGAESITYSQYDGLGVAKLISNYANDLPRSDIKGRQFTSPVRSLGASYGYNLQEIRAAKMVGKPLEQRKANHAKKAIMQLENTIAFFGDADHGLGGFLSNPNITVVSVAANGNQNGAVNSTLWVNKTPDQILADMNQVSNTPFNLTKGVETADTVLLPLEQYTLISSTARSANSDTTILDYFKKNNPFIKEVTWLNEMKGVGMSGTNAMLAYRRDPDALTLEIPQDFEQLPVQERGLEFEIACHSRIGGVIIYYPLSIARGDGI